MKRNFMYRLGNPDPSKRPKLKVDEKPIEKITTKEAEELWRQFNKMVLETLKEN